MSSRRQSHNPQISTTRPPAPPAAPASHRRGLCAAGHGTYTGGSIRGPFHKQRHRRPQAHARPALAAGIIPAALSSTPAPDGPHVTDLAISLNVTAGTRPADDATKKSAGKVPPDYTKFLDATALKGARIGVARDFFGQDAEVDTVIRVRARRNEGAGCRPHRREYPPIFTR